MGGFYFVRFISRIEYDRAGGVGKNLNRITIAKRIDAIEGLVGISCRHTRITIAKRIDAIEGSGGVNCRHNRVTVTTRTATNR